MRRGTLFFVAMIVLLTFLSGISAAAELYVWPVAGKVLLPFKSDAHRGMDIGAAVGDTVVSTQDGTVIWIGKTPRGESCLTIEHDGGVSSTYIPVIASVSKGQKVGAGDTVGTISSEGDPSISEPHLHFGIYDTATRDDKNYLDPAGYLPAISTRLSTESKKEVVEPAVQEVSNLSVEVIPSGENSLKSTDSQLQIPESINTAVGQSNVHDVTANHMSYEASYGENDGQKSAVNSAADSYMQKVPVSNIVSAKQGSEILTKNGKQNSAGSQTAKNNGSVDSARCLIRDDTFHAASDNVSELSSSYATQMKDDKNSAKIARAQLKHVASTGNLSNELLAQSQRQQIEAINPFAVKKAGGERSLKASVASGEVPQLDGLQSYSNQQHSAVSGWINRIAAWDSLPDVIAILAIIGIIVMSAFKFVRNTEVGHGILPGTVNAAC